MRRETNLAIFLVFICCIGSASSCLSHWGFCAYGYGRCCPGFVCQGYFCTPAPHPTTQPPQPPAPTTTAAPPATCLKAGSLVGCQFGDPANNVLSCCDGAYCSLALKCLTCIKPGDTSKTCVPGSWTTTRCCKNSVCVNGQCISTVTTIPPTTTTTTTMAPTITTTMAPTTTTTMAPTTTTTMAPTTTTTMAPTTTTTMAPTTTTTMAPTTTTTMAPTTTTTMAPTTTTTMAPTTTTTMAPTTTTTMAPTTTTTMAPTTTTTMPCGMNGASCAMGDPPCCPGFTCNNGNQCRPDIVGK